MIHKVIQGILLGLIMGGLGIFMGYQGIDSWGVYSSSSSWTKTPAMIEELKLIEHTKKERVTGYSIKISYRYQAGGQECRSERLRPDGMGDYSSEQEVRSVYDPLSTAAHGRKPIEVLVNPTAPQEAVVIRVFTMMIPGMILGGLVLLGLGGWFGYSAVRDARSGASGQA